MNKALAFIFLFSIACSAQSTKPSEPGVTSIPNTSLDEFDVSPRSGKLSGNQPQFSLNITAPKGVLQAGLPENIIVVISNLTDKEIAWSPGYNDVRVTVYKGATEAERTALHRNFRGEPKNEDPLSLTSGSSITLLIPPHKAVSQTLDLRKLYEISEDGEYTVIVQRYDSASNVFVRSNKLSIVVRK